MKIKLCAVGSMRNADLARLTEFFASKIKYYWPFELVEIADAKASRGPIDVVRRKEAEGEKLLELFAPGDFVVLFDERGKEFTSVELSNFIVRKTNELPRNLCFVIGGPYGFSEGVYSRADMKLSMSKMTFTHEMARLFAAEQLYRAGTISRGEPYHHD